MYRNAACQCSERIQHHEASVRRVQWLDCVLGVSRDSILLHNSTELMSYMNAQGPISSLDDVTQLTRLTDIEMERCDHVRDK